MAPFKPGLHKDISTIFGAVCVPHGGKAEGACGTRRPDEKPSARSQSPASRLQNPLIPPVPGQSEPLLWRQLSPIGAAAQNRAHRVRPSDILPLPLRPVIAPTGHSSVRYTDHRLGGRKKASNNWRQRATMLLVPTLSIILILLLVVNKRQWWPLVGAFLATYLAGLLGGRLSRAGTAFNAYKQVLMALLVPAVFVVLILLLMMNNSHWWPLACTFFATYLVGLLGGAIIGPRPRE